jgi:hypothetical protein
MPVRKTFIREISMAMLAVLLGFFIWGVYEPVALDIAKFLSVPVFGFTGGAFALTKLDAMMK